MTDDPASEVTTYAVTGTLPGGSTETMLVSADSEDIAAIVAKDQRNLTVTSVEKYVKKTRKPRPNAKKRRAAKARATTTTKAGKKDA